jgi:hypothetical protein
MSDERHDRVLELLPAFALECLDEAEMIMVSEYLALNEAAQLELVAIQATIDQLSLAAPAVAPAPELKQRLMARLRVEPSLAPPALAWAQRLRLGFQQLMANGYWQMAMLGLIVLLLATNFLLWRQLAATDSLSPEAGRLQVVSLAGTSASPQSEGFLTISADGLSGAIVVDELPSLDEDHQYQLWLVRGHYTHSGALFSVDELGYGGARVAVPYALFGYSAAFVTVEPAGGSESPSDEPVMYATLFDP